jgi:hypothetical protein
MSKFVVSPRDCTHLVEKRQTVALNKELSVKIPFGSFDVLFFAKKNSSLQFFEHFQDGFIGCIGTPIFFKDFPLKDIFKGFQESELGHICDFIGGHFVLLIQKENYLYVISDGIGSIDVFYGSDQKPIVSNDLSCVALSSSLEYVSEMCEIESVCLSPGKSTVFNHVQKLIGGIEYLKIGESGDVEVFRHGNSIRNRLERFSSWQDSDYFDRVKMVFDAISKSNQTIGLNFTGGLDGRTILASLLEAEAHVAFYYGKGNSQITNTQEKDLQIAKEVANDLKIPIHIMDWKTETRDGEETEVLKDYLLLGSFAKVHGGSEAFVQSLIDRNQNREDIVFMGGFSPGFSNKDFHERHYPTFQEILNDCLKGPLQSVAFKYYKKVFKKFYHECRLYCLAHELIDEHDDLLVDGHVIRALLYLRPESEHLQLFNLFDKYVAPYNTNELLIPMLSLNTSFRRGRKLQLNLIHQLRPDLLNYHLFSGIADRTITKNLAIDTKKEEKKSFKIPNKYLAYRYYIFKRPIPKKHHGQDLEMYTRVMEQLTDQFKKRWFGFVIFNLRYCLRLRFSYRIIHYQRVLMDELGE